MHRFSQALIGLVALTLACSGSKGPQSPAVTLSSLAVTPSILRLSIGQPQALSVSGLFSDGTTMALTDGNVWLSTSDAVAAVSASGVVTGVGSGSAIISLASHGLTATVNVTVSAGIPPVLTSISVGAIGHSLEIGDTFQLIATGTYSDGSSAVLSSGVNWSSSASAIGSVSATGLVTALSAGSATFTASDGTLTASVSATVNPAPAPVLLSVALTSSASHVDVGATAQLQLTGTFDSGPSQDLTAIGSYTASDPTILSIGAAGLVTGLKNGAATITASATISGVVESATLAIAVGESTLGQIFFAGAYASDVTFAGSSQATNNVTIDAQTQNPAGHGSLKIAFPASSLAGSTGGVFLASAPRDLSGFDALTFWAKASAPLTLGKVGLGDSGGVAPNTAEVEMDGLAISSSWQKVVIPLPLPSKLAQSIGLASFADSTNHQSQTLWISDLQYEKLGASVLGAPAVQFTSTSRTVQATLTSPIAASDLQIGYTLQTGAVTLVDPDLSYFSFSSDAPAIASVSASGVITGVAVGSANISASLGAATSSNAIAVTVTPAAYDPAAGWTLVWSDEFDGTALDETIWNYDLGSGGWGNNESECYQKQNAVVDGGYLTITAKEEVGCVDNAPYTSARIQTAQKKQFTYGKLSMRAKLPYSQAMWPAFWMLGADSNSQNGIYGGDTTWPGCGEIDIMEMIGGLADGSGDYTTHGTLHYLNAGGRDPGPSYAYRYPSKLTDDFHVYEIVWTPHSFTWKIDGLSYGTKIMDSDMTALQAPMFILLNLAVGGPWGGWVDGSTVFPQTYVIDYVRQYTNASITAGGSEGLASVWHLVNTPSSGATPAGETLQSAAGTVSGFQPLKTLSAAASWYSPALSGSYEDGAWQVAVFSTSPGGASVVKAEVFVTAADGSNPVSLGSAQVDVNSTGAGNHRSYFTLTGVPAETLSNQRLKVTLSPVSGIAPEMIYNGNDFDTHLSAPWSAAP